MPYKENLIGGVFWKDSSEDMNSIIKIGAAPHGKKNRQVRMDGQTDVEEEDQRDTPGKTRGVFLLD